MPRGRPSKFGTIDMRQVEVLARVGWTDAGMAEFFGVALSTWSEWKEKHGDFREALKDWKREADQRVERSLYERATGYSAPDEKIFMHEGKPVRVETTKHYPPDTTACIFWLKNRDKENWRDAHHVAVSPGEMNDIERAQRLAAIISGPAGGETGRD